MTVGFLPKSDVLLPVASLSDGMARDLPLSRRWIWKLQLQCCGAGHHVVLCTDDSGVFATSLSKEYALAAEAFGLGHDQLFALASASVDHSFASREEKALLMGKILAAQVMLD